MYYTIIFHVHDNVCIFLSHRYSLYYRAFRK